MGSGLQLPARRMRNQPDRRTDRTSASVSHPLEQEWALVRTNPRVVAGVADLASAAMPASAEAVDKAGPPDPPPARQGSTRSKVVPSWLGGSELPTSGNQLRPKGEALPGRQSRSPERSQRFRSRSMRMKKIWSHRTSKSTIRPVRHKPVPRLLWE
jgi:hypothetical protein